MAKAPSVETQLRTAKTEIKKLRLYVLQQERERNEFRARATKAEQEAAEWKRLFDLLLHNVEKLGAGKRVGGTNG